MTVGTWNLLEKTELRIERIGLEGANLTDVARVVAGVLGLPTEEVFVIDARDDLLTLDVLRDTIDAYQLLGKQDTLLAALGALPGVMIGPDTSVCSEGMLGWIAADATEGRAALDRSRKMAAEIAATIAARAIVFSTGPEVASGQIEDTNKPWIAARLTAADYRVTEGENLPDDLDAIAFAIREAAEERGFGLVITTGGVGAETKDGTVEALLSLDANAATPYLFKVQEGKGRHVKPGVRIAVGQVTDTLVVCLPGPNDEARLGIEALLDGLGSTRETVALAERIAAALRERLRNRHGWEGHHHVSHR
jgi:molybdenum cofactor synthesis domain-containing protein